MEKNLSLNNEHSYLNHLTTHEDLVTTYEAIRSGFVSLALERSRRVVPYIFEARALEKAVISAKKANDLLYITGIEQGLLTASGLSEKAIKHLSNQDKKESIQNLAGL